MVLRSSPRASSTRSNSSTVAPTFVGTVQLGLHDVDATGAAIADSAPPSLDVVDGGETADHGIEEALRYLFAIGGGDGIGVHMQTHIADEQQAPPG